MTSEAPSMSSIEERVKALETKIARIEKILQTTGGSPEGIVQKSLSIREFINAKKPGPAREKTLAIAYFIEHHEGIVPFDVRDLETGFRAAKVPPPQNINDMVNKNIGAGLLMESKDKKNGRKAWELTATGENVVEAGFPRKGR